MRHSHGTRIVWNRFDLFKWQLGVLERENIFLKKKRNPVGSPQDCCDGML